MVDFIHSRSGSIVRDCPSARLISHLLRRRCLAARDTGNALTLPTISVPCRPVLITVLWSGRRLHIRTVRTATGRSGERQALVEGLLGVDDVFGAAVPRFQHGLLQGPGV